MGLMNNDVVRVQWRGLCFGQRIILNNDYIVIGDLNPLTSVAQDLGNILASAAVGGVDDKTTRYLACLPPQYTMTDMRAQKLNPARSAYVSLATPATVGTHASPATVANDSAALTLRTPLAGRKFYGTKHIGPIPDAASAAGLLTGAYKTILGLFGADLIAPLVPGGVGGYLANCVLNMPTLIGTFTTNFIVGDQSRVQRRRTVGIGE
jgi:hypothetical protein